MLRVLTRGNATFTKRKLDRYLAKHLSDAAEHLDVRGRVLEGDGTLVLHDPATGEATGRYTTREVRNQKRAALADGALGAAALEAAQAGRSLREDQPGGPARARGARALSRGGVP